VNDWRRKCLKMKWVFLLFSAKFKETLEIIGKAKCDFPLICLQILVVELRSGFLDGFFIGRMKHTFLTNGHWLLPRFAFCTAALGKLTTA